jgi:putative ABC transport system substrate-binding protein
MKAGSGQQAAGTCKSRSKKKSVFCFSISALFLALCFSTEAQQPKIYKIGELTARPGLRRTSDEFLQALRELGYIQGKNIAFEVLSAEGKPDRFPALANELIRHKVDILVASSNAEALALKNATKKIPIVFYTGGDPVKAGLVESLARPGGNVTGVTLISAELFGKRLEILKETIPKLSRAAVLWVPGPLRMSAWEETLKPARELGIELHSMEIRSADELDTAFKQTLESRSSAVVMQLHPLFAANQKEIVNRATKSRLPMIYPRRDFVATGGLMSYGSDRDEPFRRAAALVDKILKGANPADLPVEQPTKFELVINLKAAKQIGLAIPANVLARADRVIK